MNTDRVEKVLARLKENLGPAARDNTVASASVIGYTYDYVHGESWFDGRLQYEDNTISSVKFKKFDRHGNGVAEAAFMFRRTLMLDEVQGVAKVRFITRCEVNDILLVCYENLENLTTWRQKSSSPILFGSCDDDDLLHTWWAESIRSMLHTIQNIHSHGFYHGELSMDATYGVSLSGQLKILGVAKSLDELEPNEVMRQKLADFIGFRDWLRNLMLAQLHHNSAMDELSFLDLFDMYKKVPLMLTYNQFVKKLTGHPFLLSPRSRIEYCFEIQKAYEQKSLDNFSVFEQYITSNPSQQNPRWKRQFKHFHGWHSRIKCHSIFEKVDNHLPGSYIWKATSLLRFLRNLKAHYVNDMEILDVDRCMRRTLCPGFLSYLHEHHMKISDRL